MATAAGLSQPALAADRAASVPAEVSENYGKLAYDLVRQWVRQGQVDAKAPTHVPLKGLFGVRITLRSGGLVVGAGNAYASPIAADGERPRDMVTLLQQATRLALKQVEQSIADAHARAVAEYHTSVGIKPAPKLADVVNDLLVDVQLGYGLTSIRVAARSPLTALYAHFAPGFHGLRIPKRSGHAAAVMWPGRALARNISPQSQLTQLLADAGDRPQDLAALGRTDGIPLQRFDVIHVVRSTFSMPAMALVRGDALLPPTPIDSRTLDGMADRVSRFLARRFTDAGAVRGTYEPTSNRYNPALADARTAALACYAMTRRLAFAEPLHHVPPERDPVLAKVHRAFVRLADHLLTHPDKAGPAATALTLLTAGEWPQPGREQSRRDKLAALLIHLHRKAGGFSQSLSSKAGAAPAAARAVAVAALADYYARTRSAALVHLLPDELEALWQQVRTDASPEVLPWFTLAQARAGELLATGDNARRELATRQRTLAQIFGNLAAQQIIGQPPLGPRDVVGGIDLRQRSPNSPPNPDWRTAELLQFMAIALRQPGITKGRDMLGWTLTAGLAARFMGQLMMDEPACYYVRSMDDARNGVRLALWDNRLATAPQAVTLLALTQLQQTLAAMK